MAGRKRKPRVVIDGIEYLPSRLIDAFRFASRLGLKSGAFHQVLAEGLFPSPGPGLLAANGIFYCRPQMAAPWWAWLRNGASVDEIMRIVEIVRESDLRRWDYREMRQDENARTWLLEVLESYTPEKWHKAI